MEILESFRQQYGALHDAKVAATCYQYSKNGFWSSVEITLECYRIAVGLQNIRLKFSGVKAFVLDEGVGMGGYHDLYGINYLFTDNHFHFDFSTESETSVEAMQKDSGFYIMSQNFSYETLTESLSH